MLRDASPNNTNPSVELVLGFLELVNTLTFILSDLQKLS